MGVEDLELDRNGASPPPAPPPTRDSTTRWIAAGAVGLALLVGGIARWWTLDRESPAPAGTPPAAATDVAVPAPAVVLPPLDEMDAFLRALLGTLSSRPELTRWLATDGLIRQMALVIDRVSKGSSPAADLKVLAPETEFQVARRGRSRTIDAASYRRYDGIAETIATLDPDAIVRGYQTIRPRLNEAYRAMGREADVHAALLAALDVLVETPVPDGPVALVEGKGATWAFADPDLEALDPAQKQLIRMGPENARRVIQTLRAVRQRLPE
jgi:hypothetical protein